MALILTALRDFREQMYETNGKGCNRLAEESKHQTDETLVPCPDIDYRLLRPAPFYEFDYSRAEIKQGGTDLNMGYYTDEFN